jgi:hypothetical protein
VYIEATVTYSVTLGYVLTFGLPFLVAVHVIVPTTERASRLWSPAGKRSGNPELT